MTGSQMTAYCIKQNLFEARTNGYHVYRIPGLVTTPAGTVLAYTEARKGLGGDWDPIDIRMRRSTDGGQTWGAPFTAVDHLSFDAEAPVNNFNCIADPRSGDVHALFCQDYARVFYTKSTDDGVSWAVPVEITDVLEGFREHYPWQVIAVGPGHGIALESGRLIAPVWMSDGSSTEFGPGRRGHRPSEVAAVYSDDSGGSWHTSDMIVRNEPRFRHPNETCVVELGDGRVLFNSRSESHHHRRIITTSPDGARDFSEPEFDEALVEPICFGSMIGLPGRIGGKDILFANPGVLERTMDGGPKDRGIGPDETGRIYDRKHLTIRLSRDNCQSWIASRRLERGPSGYSDLTTLPDGTVLCLYECGLASRMFDDQYLRLARFNVEWVEQMQGNPQNPLAADQQQTS